ncbi:MAG: hypothetical protein K2N72_10240, partial [Oscillospiraceae bacterium]|nr:hypothetical protein [Oscillospiraceae bacterium]
KGEDITFTNFPGAADDSSGAGILRLGTQFAISNKSTFKEGAWEFIMDIVKSTVTEGSIPNWGDAEPKEDISGEIVYSSDGSGFPVYSENLDKIAIQATKPRKYIDGEGNVQLEDNTYWINGMEIKSTAMSEEDVNFMKDYLKSITKINKYDENINNIIKEESDLYFSGSKSADETASVIQSRVSIYLNEQYR